MEGLQCPCHKAGRRRQGKSAFPIYISCVCRGNSPTHPPDLCALKGGELAPMD